jgi:fructose-1,6-bisphosphatase/inositol monophosphatase family enzyme
VTNSQGLASTTIPVADEQLRQAVADYLEEVAKQFIIPRFCNLRSYEIDNKTGPDDLVTVADREAEAWLIPRLGELQAGHCIGEETVALKPELRKNVADGYAWSIDPIDGTNNFVRGVTDFCSMVALMWNGVPIQCWIWLPVDQCLYYASAGSGAYCYSNSISRSLKIPSSPYDPREIVGSGNVKGLNEPYKSKVLDRMRTIKGRHYVGSAGVLATRIAEGRENFLMHGRSTPWDHAPVDLLCREAGGHAAMIKDSKPFNGAFGGPIMATSSKTMWECLYKNIWSQD